MPVPDVCSLILPITLLVTLRRDVQVFWLGIINQMTYIYRTEIWIPLGKKEILRFNPLALSLVAAFFIFFIGQELMAKDLLHFISWAESQWKAEFCISEPLKSNQALQ